MNQSNSASDRTFFHRTTKLAVRMGCSVEELPGIMGIGRRTLFECRSADSAVSDKSWAKLEEAERLAGIGQSGPGIAESEAKPNDSPAMDDCFSSVLREEPAHYGAKPRPGSNDQARALARLEIVLEGLQAQLELVREQIRAMKKQS